MPVEYRKISRSAIEARGKCYRNAYHCWSRKGLCLDWKAGSGRILPHCNPMGGALVTQASLTNQVPTWPSSQKCCRVFPATGSGLALKRNWLQWFCVLCWKTTTWWARNCCPKVVNVRWWGAGACVVGLPWIWVGRWSQTPCPLRSHEVLKSPRPAIRTLNNFALWAASPLSIGSRELCVETSS